MSKPFKFTADCTLYAEGIDDALQKVGRHFSFYPFVEVGKEDDLNEIIGVINITPIKEQNMKKVVRFWRWFSSLFAKGEIVAGIEPDVPWPRE